MPLTYQLEPSLAADEFIDVLVRSTLAERRPIHDADKIQRMLANADLLLTARSCWIIPRRAPETLKS